MGSINQQFLVSFLIIALGYAMRRTNFIQASDGEALARAVFNITLPALIISTFSTISIDVELLLLAVIGLGYGAGMALLGVSLFRRADRRMRGLYGMLLPGFNIGLFAYPLVEAVWGQEGLKYFGMFDVGNSLVVFGVCYLTAGWFAADRGSLDLASSLRRLRKSIPLMAYAIAFLLALAGWQLPPTALAVASVLGKANMPLSLLLLGVFLDFSFAPGFWRNTGSLFALRYGLGLACGVLVYLLAPANAMFKATLLIGFILPIATAVIPYAVEFDYYKPFVGTVANLSILTSFVLVWLLVGFIT